LADRLESVGIDVRVRRSKQQMSIGMNFGGAEFDLRAKKVREQISLDLTAGSARKICDTSRNGEVRFVTSESLQVSFDSDVVIEIVRQGAATAIQAVAFRV
jgi:hypothetical protein